MAILDSFGDIRRRFVTMLPVHLTIFIRFTYSLDLPDDLLH